MNKECNHKEHKPFYYLGFDKNRIVKTCSKCDDTIGIILIDIEAIYEAKDKENKK